MNNRFRVTLVWLTVGFVTGCTSAEETTTASDASARQNALRLAEQVGVETAAVYEGAAVGVLRTINVAQVAFLSSTGGYADSFDDLLDEGLLDPQFRDGGTLGYTYELHPDSASGFYSAVATPDDPGGRHFYTGPDGIIRSEIGKPAIADSAPFQ